LSWKNVLADIILLRRAGAAFCGEIWLTSKLMRQYRATTSCADRELILKLAAGCGGERNRRLLHVMKSLPGGVDTDELLIQFRCVTTAVPGLHFIVVKWWDVTGHLGGYKPIMRASGRGWRGAMDAHRSFNIETSLMTGAKLSGNLMWI
jgi:predicted flavoprotein YhiN